MSEGLGRVGARQGGRPLCVGSEVMCRVKRGTLRSGDDEMKQKNDEI